MVTAIKPTADDLIELHAEAICNATGGPQWDELQSTRQAGIMRAEARAALAVVAPLIAAKALREAAQKYQWGGWAERNPTVHADLASRRRQSEHAVAWLRTRADKIEGDQP